MKKRTWRKKTAALLAAMTVISGMPDCAASVEEAKAADLPFIVEDTDYGIKNSLIKAKKLTLTDENAYIEWDERDFAFVMYTPEEGESMAYLVGVKGHVASYNLTEEKEEPRVEMVSSYLLAEGGCLGCVYKIQDPVSLKWDLYNAATGEFYPYQMDEIDRVGECIIVEKDGLEGLAAQDGKMLYEPCYESVFVSKSAPAGCVNVYEGKKDDKYAVLTSNGSTDGQVFYDFVGLPEYYGQKGALCIGEKSGLLQDKELYGILFFDSAGSKLAGSGIKYVDISAAKAGGNFLIDENGYTMGVWEDGEGDNRRYDVISENEVWEVGSKFSGSEVRTDRNSGNYLKDGKLYIWRDNFCGYVDVYGNVICNTESLEKNPVHLRGFCKDLLFVDDWSSDKGFLQTADGKHVVDYIGNDTVEVIGNYLWIYSLKDSTYKMLDPVSGEILVDYGYYNGKNGRLTHQNIILHESFEGNKFGIFNGGTGAFSGYKFEYPEGMDMNDVEGAYYEGDTYVNGEHAIWEFDFEREDSLYINDAFEILNIPEGYNMDSDWLGADENMNFALEGGYDEDTILIMDYHGNVITEFPYEYDYLDRHTVRNGKKTFSSYDEEEGLYGIVRADGTRILENEFDTVRIAENGMVCVDSKTDHMGGIIDLNGNFLVQGSLGLWGFNRLYSVAKFYGENYYDNEYYFYDLSAYKSEASDDTKKDSLQSAVYKYGSKSYDVLKTAHSIETTHRPFDLICKAKDGVSITKYALYSGDKKIQESTNGEFLQVDASKFVSGKDVSIKAYGTQKAVKTQLLLEVKDKKIGFSEMDFSKAGLSFTLDDDVPFFGGSEINLNFPTVPVHVVVEDGKIKAGINIKEKELYSSNSYEGVTTTWKKKTIKEKMEGWKKDLYKTGLIKKDWKGYLEQANLKADVPFFTKEREVTIFGYAEGEWSDSFESFGGEIIIAVSGSATRLQKQMLVFQVPVTLNCTIEGTIGGNGAIKYDFINNQLAGNVGVNGSVTIEPYAGVGIGTWLSVGVYGQISGGIEATLLASDKTEGVDSIYVTGEAGAKGYFAKKEVVRVPLLSFENLKNTGFGPFIDSSNRFLFYSRTENSLFHRKSAKSFINNTSDPVFVWNRAASSSFHSAAARDFASVLVENAYGAADPQIASAKGETVAVWLDNEESRALSNQTVVKYAVYDSDTKQFSDCKIALDDGTADYKPQLYTDGEEIYLYYQDSKKCYGEGEDPDISEYAGTFAVTVAKYDAFSKTFIKLGTIQRENDYCYAPALTKTDGGLLLAWAENKSNHVFGLTDDNSVNYSVYKDGAWSEPKAAAEGLNSITSLATGNLEGNDTIAYCMDMDNDLTTPEQKLYLADQSGEAAERMEAPVAGLLYMTLPDSGRPAFLYNQNGAAVYITGMEDEPVEILAEGTMDTGSRMQAYGNRLYYLKSDGKSRNIYCAVHDKGKWGSVPLTKETSYIDAFSFAGDRGIYLATEADLLADEEVNTMSRIRFLDALEVHDLKIENADFDAFHVEAGEDLEITLAITNNGTQTAENLSAAFYLKDDPDTCQTMEIPGVIRPGETVNETITVLAPWDFTDAVYRIKVEETGEEDNNKEDNQFEIDLSKTELCVNTEYKIEQGQKKLVVHISNYSNVSTAADVQVRNPDGVILHAEEGIEVSGQETVDFVVPVEESWLGANKETVFIVEANADLEEYYDSNNICDQRVWDIKTWEPIVSDLSEGEKDTDIFIYELNSDGKTATITKCTSTDADITVPPVIDGYTVTGIGKGAFSGSRTLKTIGIPKSVVSIQENAFLNSGVKTIYYAGTKEDWKKIKIALAGNTAFLNASVKGADGKIYSADATKWNASNTGNSSGVGNSGNKQNTVKKPSVSKVKSFKAKAGKKKLTLSWKKLSGAGGYQIQIGTKKNFKGSKTAFVSKWKKKYVRKGLKSKKKYYVRIRAYKTYRKAGGAMDRVYGPWSKTSKKVK